MDLLTYIISGISLITTLVGLYYVSEKNKIGFIYYTVSVSIQGYLFFVMSNWFLLVQMIILGIYNIYIYLKWRKEDGNVNN